MRIKKIIIIIFTIVVLYLLYFIILANVSNNKALSGTKNYVNIKIDKEDSLVFKKTELVNLKPVYVMKHNFRNDIKCFKYKTHYQLYITKLEMSKDISLHQLITLKEKSSKQSSMHSYEVISSGGLYDFLFLGEKTDMIDKIIFNLDGNIKQLRKHIFNKNFVSYYLPVSSFSLRYYEDSPIDIFFGCKETLLGRETYSIMISFYKIHKSLYVLILIPDKNEMNLDGDLFGKIMNDNSKE